MVFIDFRELHPIFRSYGKLLYQKDRVYGITVGFVLHLCPLLQEAYSTTI